ncbi:hypothetical protein G5714_004066 [Onychostoma macrolepis]|uniref:Uncharacterized protein n=1 Tax=Onychostoma macrolepis TaxID=369639 RepID=A0A7J6DB81_9TELE|nr:hypothetical protein G5714_004066 [Onychostoma macrolepis]
MLEEMERENAALQRQSSQLPEIISAFQEMRQQNAALWQELQNLKSKQRSTPESVTLPMPSQRSHSPAVNLQTPQPYRPIPAPRSRLPPSATKIPPHTAVPEETSELTEDLRNMNISSSPHERPSFTAHYSDSAQFRLWFYQSSLP